MPREKTDLPKMFKSTDGKTYAVMPPQFADSMPYVRFDFGAPPGVSLVKGQQLALDDVPGFKQLNKELTDRGFKFDVEGLQLNLPTNALGCCYNGPDVAPGEV